MGINDDRSIGFGDKKGKEWMEIQQGFQKHVRTACVKGSSNALRPLWRS